ncbi:hypothetical protein [Phenylobacterium sp.]|uniref:hypothetical protein n=1 Tax=Phenylobacterium sp. TaxID=1871053 RepID=UPI0028116677|nr:hypothetical protein [Phenylobacterium sp.]
MRLAISSLILAAGLATAAQAQDQAQPAAQPATPAPAAEQPAAAPAAQAPAAEAPAAAPQAPPALPTSGDGAALLSVLETVCKPAVRGQKLDDLAKANGFKQNRRDMTWAKPLGGHKAYQIVLFPQGSNKDSCFGEVRFAHGQDAPLTQALNVWAFVQQPPLDPTANYTQPQDPDGLKRVRRSWEHVASNQSIGVNISVVRKPDDTPVNRAYDLATFQYQERKF